MRCDPVTVVIPTKDRPELLPATLGSVLGQRDVDLRVVVVEDGSRRPSTACLEDVDPRLRVLRHETSLGVSAARNTGLAVVDTPWVAFVDDDDLWAPDKLAHQLEALGRDRSCRWACSAAVPFYPDGTLALLQRPPVHADVSRALLRTNVIPGGGSGVLVETDLLRALGGFDVGLTNLADWDCWLRLAQLAPLARVDRPDVGYRRHASSLAHAVERSERELQQIRRKHSGLYTATGADVDTAAWEGSQNRLRIESGRWREGVCSSWWQYRAHGHRRALLQPLRYPRRLSVRRVEERFGAWQDPAGYAYVREWLDRALAGTSRPAPAETAPAGRS